MQNPENELKQNQQHLLKNPKDINAQINCGNLCVELKRYEEAAGYFRRLLRIFKNNQDLKNALCYALQALGNEAHMLGRYMMAEACFEEALQHQPNHAGYRYNLGNAQRELGKAKEAALQYQKAIQLNPDDADFHNNLGNVQRELGQLDLAIASYEHALKLNPQLYHAKVHLAHQKQHVCDWPGLDHAIAEIRHWVSARPDAQISPFAFLAMPATTAEEQKVCADNWVNNRYAKLVALGKTQHFTHAKNATHKIIRIGYLSADFRLHPLAFLISELIELHDRAQFEIFAFSFGVNDKSTARARLEKAFDKFYDIRALSEIDAAKTIHQNEIDILIDLTGFTQTSRSGIAALRPAPININWLGFPGTMGCTNGAPLFDYLLTDNFITPDDATANPAKNYAEKLAPLPYSYQPNDRKRPVGKTPSRQACNLPEGKFVFCCFNQSFKITAEIFAVWMRLLKAIPDSVLWLLECNPWATENLKREAEISGVAVSRLIFAPRIGIADHLARHAHADIFLDTLPYNAHTTCSDALWMGLPVLTCAGNTFASRVAGSLIKTAGLTEWVTFSLKDYEQKALDFAKNPEAILCAKQKLLAEKMHSELFDTAKFVQGLESIFQGMWQHYLGQNDNEN
ncbi:MAG: glycosyltransferase [Betaproteobacteria bacterium HGW-Betaproteobacteria-22]|nr:MAG: glycosyltransferase [Betaproteobacteria bacterium HGW-Betaproteobacteria-22]